VKFLGPGPITPGGAFPGDGLACGLQRGTDIFVKTSVRVIKLRGARSPVSGFAFWAGEEGDGVAPGAGGAKGGARER
jgi:hypothetical protein